MKRGFKEGDYEVVDIKKDKDKDGIRQHFVNALTEKFKRDKFIYIAKEAKEDDD